MAQAQQQFSLTGSPTGNNDYCTNCGGNLIVQDGTDYDVANATVAFEETYQCDSCGDTGTLQEKDGNTVYTGACKGEHRY